MTPFRPPWRESCGPPCSPALRLSAAAADIYWEGQRLGDPDKGGFRPKNASGLVEVSSHPIPFLSPQPPPAAAGAFITSAMDPGSRSQVFADLRSDCPALKLLYVTPEFLNASTYFQNLLGVSPRPGPGLGPFCGL